MPNARSRLGATVVIFLISACQAAATPPVSTPASSPDRTLGASASVAEPTTPTTTTPTTTSPVIDPRADGLDVVCTDQAASVEVGVIRPGRVTIVVRNAGRHAQTFEARLDHSGSGSGSDGDSGTDRDRTKIETRPIHPGEIVRIEADLAPGRYEIECDHDGGAGERTRASLVVRAGAPLVARATGSEQAAEVRIVQFAMVPSILEVPVGARVTWVDDDPAPHTITADGGGFDSRQLDPGATFSLAFDSPGNFTYHCEIHPTMVGTVVVH